MDVSSDHDLWGTDNSDYVDALNDVKLSSPSRDGSPEGKLGQSLKRKRSPDLELLDDDDEFLDVNPSVLVAQKASKAVPNAKDDMYVYGAAKFGGWGEYMFRKRAKLQIQNAEYIEGDRESSGGGSQIFKGVAIYVNGFTDPPFQDLREMVMAHGGVFHAYLDKKSMVTHIIASQLTPAKILEYQRAKLKVVKPEWIVKSVEAGVLLRWQDFALKPGTGAIAAHEKGSDFAGATPAVADVDQASSTTNRIPQMTLAQSFATQKRNDALSAASSSKFAEPKTPVKTVYSDSPIRQPISHAVEPQTPTKARAPEPDAPKSMIADSSKQSGHTLESLRSPSTIHASLKTVPDPNLPEGLKSPEKPSYALYDSNPLAAKLMESTQWRNEHTAANAVAFTESYFQNSRLHHLSTWKSELRKLVAEAREHAERDEAASGIALDPISMRGVQLKMPSRKGKEKAVTVDRVIMHCDFDSFFVAAGLVDRPHLKGKPVVVCHSGGGKASTSEIASASYEARSFGIKNGMSLGQARQLCPAIQTVPYEFEKYKTLSLKFYTILMSFADDLQAVSVDEALLDVSQRVAALKAGAVVTDKDFAKELAEQIRDKVREATGCEVSIGISHNIMLARMATRHAKPAKSYHLLPEDVPTHVAPLRVDAVHGVGWSIRERIKEKFGIETLGELLGKSKESLQRLLGEKTGDKMWKAARGIDDTPLESDKPRKSVSAEVNYGIRFENSEQAETFMYALAAEVSKRLVAVGRKGKSLTLKIMVRSADAPKEAAKFMGHGNVNCHNKATAISDSRGGPTDDADIIGRESCKLLNAFGFDPTELRGIGIQIQKLDDEVGPAGGLDQGQSRLQFGRSAGPKGKQPPASVFDADALESEVDSRARKRDIDVPTASQIDLAVLDNLPEDIRAEILENLNNTRGEPSTTLGRSKTVPASPPRHVELVVTDVEGFEHHPRSQSLPPASSQSDDIIEVPKPAAKTTSVSPTKAKIDVKHITKQLAPKRKIPFVSPTTSIGPFVDKSLVVSDTELKALGVDPTFFRELPKEIQKEQLSILKEALRAGSEGIWSEGHARSKSPSVGPLRKPVAPIPVATYTELPTIKKLSKPEDVQNMIGEWVNYRKTEGPIPAEVERISSYLVKCTASAVGLENAATLLRWWRMLLRQKWKAEEDLGDTIDVDGSFAGRAWWNAFREAKARVDSAAKRKFGCKLGLGS